MTKTVMDAMLDTMEFPIDQWFDDSELSSINLTSDGRQVYDELEQRLYYDSTVGTIKVKYYSFDLVSAVLNDVEVISATSFKIVPDKFGYYSIFKPIRQGLKKFRNPQVGDIVYTVDKISLELIAAAIITSISTTTVTLDRNLTINKAAHLVAYASGKVLKIDNEGAIAAIKPDTYVMDYRDNATVLVYKTPRTPYTADIYIGCEGVTGFSMKRYDG
jgi:hypothetical protein